MCLTIPAKVLSINGKHALVNFRNKKERVILGTIKPKIGDYILISSGIAIQIITKEDARKIGYIDQEMSI